MPRIYYPELRPNQTDIEFTAKQAQHIRVLRLNVQDEITLFNGQGLIAQVRLTAIHKKSIQAEILSFDKATPLETFPVHLAMSLIRNEPMDWAIQKAVELGVREITPIIAERTQGRLNKEQAQKRSDHWQEIIISACEQSGLNWLPQLSPMVSFAAFIQQQNATHDLKLILDPYVTTHLLSLEHAQSFNKVKLLIGPEGGFTKHELNIAKEGGFIGVCLHEQILRAETAALSAVAITQFYFSA